MRWGRIARAALVAAALAGLACAVNPATGRRQLSLVSEADEIAMGKQADPQIVAEYGLYDDPELAAYVDAVGQKLAALSHRPDLQFTFRVLDSPVINAFALPGGYIYVTRGILAHMNNEAELAIVLGHEIGHVTARHGVAQQSKQTLLGAGLQLGAIFSPQVARYGDALQEGLGLLFLKFSRDDENQADDLGVTYALRAGYDAREGAHFFEVLDRQSQESGQTLPGWLSTHPAPADRVQHTQALAVGRAPAHPDAHRVAAAELKQRLDGLVFGIDPRQGFMAGNLFQHPGLGFQIALPKGWGVTNAPSAVLAQEPQKQAMIQLTLEKSQGLGAADFAAKVIQQRGVRSTEGAAERIGGADGYLVVLQVAQEQQTAVVQAGFVNRPGEPTLFQLLGVTTPERFATHRPAFLSTIRSLQPLADPAAARVQPNRVEIETLPSATTLEAAVKRAGAMPVGLGVVALLNNLQPGSTLRPGFQLKVVRGNHRPAPGS